MNFNKLLIINFLLFKNYEKKQILFVFAALIMVALATSCQKVPQEQIDAAKAAIESVRAAQGDLYVPEEFGALQDSLASAMAAIEVQKSKH